MVKDKKPLIGILNAIAGPIDLFDFLNKGSDGAFDEYGSHIKKICYDAREIAARDTDWKKIVISCKDSFELEENNFKFLCDFIDISLSTNNSLN